MVVRELLIGLGFTLDDSKIKKADQGMDRLKNSASSLSSTLGGVAATLAAVFSAREFIQVGDAWTNIYSRIGLVTKSAAEQAAMQKEVFAIAQRTRQEYEATGDLYVKMARNSEALGASQQDVLDVTETVNKSLVIGGASTAEAKSTILQLGQALSSGRLAGDELRSLSENAPLLFKAIADYYGVAIGALKDMGAEGKLTAEGVFKAILGSKKQMDKEFSKMPVTVGQAMTYSMNRLGRSIFDLNQETGVFQKIAEGIVNATDATAKFIEEHRTLIKWVGIALGAFVTLWLTAAMVNGVLGAIATVSAAVSGLTGVVGWLTKAFEASRLAALALQTVGWIGLILLFIELLKYIWHLGEEMEGVSSTTVDWGKKWQQVKDDVQAVIDKVMELWNWVTRLPKSILGFGATVAQGDAWANDQALTSAIAQQGQGRNISVSAPIEITQNIAGSNATPAAIGQAAGNATGDALGPITKNLTNGGVYE